MWCNKKALSLHYNNLESESDTINSQESMMNVRDFTEEMRNEIVSAAKRSLMMIGVTADITISVDEKKNRIKLETSKFNTTPVIYQSVEISGSAELCEVEGHEGLYDLNFYLNYWFEIFGGGHNGTSLGALKFRVFEERKEARLIGFVIR